jgi:glycerol-3-phosphate dehydrogenase (NAD(P)+)
MPAFWKISWRGRVEVARIVVLGAGLAGSAFCVPLADQGHEVRLVGTHVDGQVIEALARSGFHPRLKVSLPPGVRPLTHDRLGEALRHDVALVVIAVSTAGVPWAAEQLATTADGRAPPVLMVTKGLAAAGGEIRVLPAVVEDALRRHGVASSGVGGIGGPCLALELAARRETAAVIAHPDPAVLERLIDLISAPYYHVRPSTDVIGVEACAALKNLVVMAVGAVMGQVELVGEAANGARMHNAAAAVFSQALGELEHLVRALGGRVETVLGLAGAGDLFVTCQGGRNGRMGRLLGRGLTYREAKSKHMPDETVEGADLALAVGPTLSDWWAKGRLDPETVPLSRALIDAICHDHPFAIPWAQLHWPP